MTYETPSITELGSVEEFTRGDWFASGNDGVIIAAGIRGNDPWFGGGS